MTVARGVRALLLDTNIVSYLLDRQSPFHERVHNVRTSSRTADFVFVSILSVYETAVGAARMNLPGDWLDQFQSEVLDGPVIPLSPEGATIFARFKIDLARRTGAKVAALARHNIDLMIAATALAEGLTLVSNDSLFRTLAEIEPALHIEDWTQP